MDPTMLCPPDDWVDEFNKNFMPPVELDDSILWEYYIQGFTPSEAALMEMTTYYKN